MCKVILCNTRDGNKMTVTPVTNNTIKNILLTPAMVTPATNLQARWHS